MNRISLTLTVMFEEQFYVGYFEMINDNQLSVSKVVFGPEPSYQELYLYVLNKYNDLSFSPSIQTKIVSMKKNPKRLQREVKEQVEKGIGTKSQQLLKLQYENLKNERKVKNRKQNLIKKQRLFELRQLKKKQKHKGR